MEVIAAVWLQALVLYFNTLILMEFFWRRRSGALYQVVSDVAFEQSRFL